MGIFDNKFYAQVKDEKVTGMIASAFVDMTGAQHGNFKVLGVDVIFTENFIVVLNTPELNNKHLNFFMARNFAVDVEKSQVILEDGCTISDKGINTRLILAAVPFKKITSCSVLYDSVPSVTDPNLPHLNAGMLDVAKLRVSEGAWTPFLPYTCFIFANKIFDEVANLVNKTQLGSKLNVKKS